MNVECYVCEREIPEEAPYYLIERLRCRKVDGSCGNDQLTQVASTSVLVACQDCVALLLANHGRISEYSQAPEEPLIIEEERLAECVEEMSQGRDQVPEARSCSICERDIEVGATYVRIHLCLMELYQPLNVTTIAIMCDRCSEFAGRAMG